MNFEEIINKYHYTEELANFLREIYEEFVGEFGKEMEPIIYEAFLNTEIVSCDNIYTCLKQRNMLEEDSLVKDEDLKMASGVYNSMPVLEMDEVTHDFKIVGVIRALAVLNLDLNSDKSKSNLIHELGHLIKSYKDEFVIYGNILMVRSGLIEKKYELTYENKKVKRKLIEEKGVGLEEGLNALLEEHVMRKIVDANYEVKGYPLLRDMVRTFYENQVLGKTIKSSQIMNGKMELVKSFDSSFGENAFFELESIMDRFYKLLLFRMQAGIDLDRQRAINEELMNIVLNEYNPFMSSINEMKKK